MTEQDTKNSSGQLSKLFNKICDCEPSFKINSIANWVELRERYYHGAIQFKEQNKLEKAHHYFHHAIICDPKHRQSYEEIVHILIELKKFDYTQHYINKLNDISPESASILRGHVYFAQNQYTNSEIQLKLCLNLNPTSQKAIFLLGLRNFLLNRLDESQINFEKLLVINKNHLEAKFCLATIKLFKKKFDQAIQEFNTILLQDPSFFLCYYHLALCYFLTSNYQASLKYCDLSLNSRFYPQCFELKTLNYFETKNRNGIEKMNKTISNHYASGKIKEDIYINSMLVECFDLIQTDPDCHDNAIEILDKSKAIINSSENQDLNELVEKLDYYSSVINILKIYKQSESKDNKYEFQIKKFKFHTNSLENYKSSNYLYLLGLNYLKKNKDTVSLKYIDQAIKLNGNNLNFYLLKNIILLRKKDYFGSIELLKRAIKLLPENGAKLRFYLTLSYLYLNNKEAAYTHLNQAISNEELSKKLTKDFCNFDLINEVKTVELFEIDQLLDPTPKLIKEKTLLQHHKHVMDVRRIKLLTKLDFNLYFDLKCVNYLLLKAIIKYENNEFDFAKELLSDAERLDDDNLGIICYLGFIYMRQDVTKSDIYIQKLFNLNQVDKYLKTYLEYYRNKMTKFILDNPNLSKKLSKKSQLLINVYYKSFDKSKKLFNEILDSKSDVLNLDENDRFNFIKIYSYLIDSYHKNRQDLELIKLTNKIGSNLEIDFETFDEQTNLNNYTSKEKEIISKACLYNGISNYNLKNYKSAKVYLTKNYSNKNESLMAEFYLNVVKLKQNEENLECILKKFENLLDLLNDPKSFDSNLDKPEFNRLEISYFILATKFKLKYYETCSDLIKLLYDDLKSNPKKLAYTQEDVEFINGILIYLKSDYIKMESVFKNLTNQDENVQNEINFHRSICLYRVNKTKPYNNILEAFNSLEMISDKNFVSFISPNLDLNLFKFKCLFYLIIKSWSNSYEHDLNLFLNKFNDLTKLYEKNFPEKVCYYLIVIYFKITLDYETGLNIAREACKLYSNNKDFNYYCGLIAFKLKQFDEAKTYFEKFLIKQISSVKNQAVSNSFYLMGLINQEAKNYIKSIEYFDLAHGNYEIDPKIRLLLIHDEFSEIDLLYSKSVSYMNMNEHSKCKKTINSVIKIIEEDPNVKTAYSDECLLIVAKSYLKNKDYEKALKKFKKVTNLSNDEKRNQVYYYTGVIYFHIEDYTNALNVFNELPDYFYLDEYGNFVLFKLKSLFFLILKTYKSSQKLIKSKMNKNLEELTQLLDNIKPNDSFQDLIEAKIRFKILILYKIVQDYEKTYTSCYDSIDFNSSFYYYAGLSKLKIYLNEKLVSKELDDYLELGKKNLEKFLTFAKQKVDQNELKLRNTYYYLALISQHRKQFNKSMDYLDNFDYYDNLAKNDNQVLNDNEKIENIIDTDEFTLAEINLLKGIVAFNLNNFSNSLDFFKKIEQELQEDNNQQTELDNSTSNVRLNQKDKINILNGVNFFLGALKHKNNNLTESLGHLAKVKRKYNYFNESRFLIGLINYEKKNYEEALNYFSSLNPTNLSELNYGDVFDYYLVKILFNLAKKEIENGKIFNLENEKYLSRVMEKCNEILNKLDLNNINKRNFEILLIKTWCLYFSDSYEELFNFTGETLLPIFVNHSEFVYLRALASVHLFNKTRDEKYLTEAYKFLWSYITEFEGKSAEFSVLKEVFENHEIEKYLTSRYFMANILTTQKYSRFEEGIRLYIEILNYKKLKTKQDDIKQLVEECLSNEVLNNLSKYFGTFREFDLYDIIYRLGVSLNEIKLYEQSFKMLYTLVNNFNLKDEKKLNNVNFYLGFSKFKLEDYKNASEYFSQYKQSSDDIQMQVPKIELARYYIGICLYNKEEPDFVRAINKFKEISQEYKNMEELADLAHYLIDSNYKLAVSCFRSNNPKWKEYFSFTVSLCDEFLNEHGLDLTSFNPVLIEVLEKKSFSLYYLKEYTNLKDFLENVCIKNFAQNDLFYYIQSICLYRLVSNKIIESNEKIQYCDETIKSINNYIKLIKNENEEISNRNKILNLKYIKTVIYLSYPDLNDKNVYFNSIETLKSIRDEFDSSNINEDDLLVFNFENLEYQEAKINYLCGKYEQSADQFEEILRKKYFKNDDFKLSDVNYYLAISLMKTSGNDHEKRKNIIKYLKNVKKESRFYSKSKFYLAYNLFKLGDLSQAFEFMQSFEKTNAEVDLVKEKLDEYRVKIPFYLAEHYLKFGNRNEAIEKFLISSKKSDQFLFKHKQDVFEYLKKSSEPKYFCTESKFNKTFYKFVTFKSWSLFHLKFYSELEKFVNEYELFCPILNDLNFLKSFSMFKLNKHKNSVKLLYDLTKKFESYLSNENVYLIEVKEKDKERYENELREKNLISLLCLADMHTLNFEQEYFYLNEFLYLACSFNSSRAEFETMNLAELIRLCRQSQIDYKFDEINLNNIIYRYNYALFKKNIKSFDHSKTTRKLSEINEELEQNANFFNQIQKDNLIFFYTKSLWEQYKQEENESENKVFLRTEIQSMIEKLRKIRLNSDYYVDSLILIAQFNYDLESIENLDKSIYHLQKLIGSSFENDSDKINDAFELLIKCYSRKIFFNSQIDQQSQDYIKFNELYDRLKSTRNSNLKELLMLTKIKVDFKVIKFKNEKSLELTQQIANEAHDEFQSNLEILFYKGKIEYLTRLNFFQTFNSYLNTCKPDSYPNAKYDIQEVKCIQLKLKIPDLDSDDLKERSNHATYLSSLIDDIKTSLNSYKSDSIDLDYLYYDIADFYFRDKYYDKCVDQIEEIKNYEKKISDSSTDYNLSYLYYMLGFSLMCLNDNLEKSLKCFSKIWLNSLFYDKSLLCQLSINYKNNNYENIILNYSSLIKGSILSIYNFDFQSYLISSKFWTCFNNFEKLTKLSNELDSAEYTKNECVQFYKQFIKIWIGSSYNFDGFSSKIDSANQLVDENLSKCSFKATNELNFINGVVSYMHKDYLTSSKLLDKLIESKISNEKCILIAKFYRSHSIFNLYKNIDCETRKERKSIEDKLKQAAITLENDLIESSYFETTRNEIHLLIGNIYFELLKLTQISRYAQSSIQNINKYFKPSLDYDDSYRLKIGICLYYEKKYIQAIDLLQKTTDTNEIMVKYYLGVCLIHEKAFDVGLKFMDIIIEKFPQLDKSVKKNLHAYYYRGVVYFGQTQPDFDKSIRDFIEQVKLNKHTESYDMIFRCLDEFKRLNKDSSSIIEGKDVLKYSVELLFRDTSNKSKWMNKVGDLYQSLIIKEKIDEHKIYFSYHAANKNTVFALYKLFDKLKFNCSIQTQNISISDEIKPESNKSIKDSLIIFNFLSPEYTKSRNCQLETKIASENGLNMIPIVYRTSQKYDNDLKEIKEKRLKKSNQEFKDLNALDYYPEIKSYFDENTICVDLTSVEDDETEEKLLENSSIVKLFDLVIEIIFCDE